MKRKRKLNKQKANNLTNTKHRASLSPVLTRILGSRLYLWMLSAPFASIATYLTIFGYLVPRISVEPPGIVDSAEPYKSFFRVQNQGYWAINDIFYTINIKDCALSDNEKGYLRPEYYPFQKTNCFRFRLQHPDSQQAQWVPIANRNDFNPHFNAKGTNKAWVPLEANTKIFISKDIVLKSDQIVLIGISPDRR